jgi:hypothetical protein
MVAGSAAGVDCRRRIQHEVCQDEEPAKIPGAAAGPGQICPKARQACLFGRQ